MNNCISYQDSQGATASASSGLVRVQRTKHVTVTAIFKLFQSHLSCTGCLVSFHIWFQNGRNATCGCGAVALPSIFFSNWSDSFPSRRRCSNNAGAMRGALGSVWGSRRGVRSRPLSIVGAGDDLWDPGRSRCDVISTRVRLYKHCLSSQSIYYSYWSMSSIYYCVVEDATPSHLPSSI